MAFRFRRKKSVRKELRRLGQRRIEKTLAKLRHCETLDAVHRVRQGIKQCRALLRLFRSAITRSDYRWCSGPLRDAAALLDSARDAHVEVTALRELARHFGQELSPLLFEELEHALVMNCREESARLSRDQSFGSVSNFLGKASCRFASVRVEDCGWEAIGRGIKRAYRDGRRGYCSARSAGRPEDFHEWRKRVKDLFYQVRLLRPIWPAQMNAAEAKLKSLGEYLGDDHDLFQLTQACRKSGLGKRGWESLKPLVDLRQKELRAQALALGAEFYVKRPTAFCARLGKHWKTWRR